MSSKITLADVIIRDDFFGFYQKLIKNEVIPYQWKALNDEVKDAAPSHAIKNFRIAAGLEEGEFYGFVFQDSDVAKWLEAAAYSLLAFPDSELERIMDETIELIGKAQLEDGYVNTYFIINGLDKRWTNLKDNHELYCAGHMIEAAVAYFEVTGKRRFLDIMCRFADYIDSVFGLEEGKLRGYPGHQEIELALLRLYEATGNKRYLNLGVYFLKERGRESHYFQIERAKRDGGSVDSNWLKYCQSHIPVAEQTEAVGHSVRAAYMYTGMAHAALETGDMELLNACRAIWDNIQQKRMYVNGGIGSIPNIEGFTGDYDLPNDTAYTETCASIALIFFAKRMLEHEKNAKYANVMERALYNLAIAGISLDGKRFFYVNPLEVDPYIVDNNVGMRHVKYERQKWFGCACCPPNLARLLASIGQYIYTADDKNLFVNLYIGSEVKLPGMTLTLETSMPYGGENKLTVRCDAPVEYTIALRIPDWADEYSVSMTGEMKDGYLYITRVWNDGDTVELNFALKPLIVRSHPNVKDNVHKVAVQRGPILYCMEEADNSKGLNRYELGTASLREREEELLGMKIVSIYGDADQIESDCSANLFDFGSVSAKTKHVDAKLIPYYMWTNRSPGEMTVWIREKLN